MTTVSTDDPAEAPEAARPHPGHLLLLAWCGPVCIGTVLLGWMVLAGFLPPPAPSLSPDETIAVWREDTDLKRIGLIVCVWGGTLYVPFSLAVMFALRRASTVLATAQAALGVFGTVFFTLNFFVLAMTPYRLETNPAGIQPLHDLGFAMTFSPVPPFTFQYLVIAVAVLGSQRPVFPRWIGYFNIFCGLLLVPPCLIPLFHTGPLAWNGVFSFWIPVVEFTAWFFVMFFGLHRYAVRLGAR